MRKRRKLIKKMAKTFSIKKISEIKNTLINIELELQKSRKNSKIAKESKALQAIKTNTKYFYSYAKRNSKIKPRVGPLYDKKKKIFTKRCILFCIIAVFVKSESQ